MIDTAIELSFEGEGAEDQATELAELLERRVGLASTVRPVAAAGPVTRTAMELLTLALTVPSTILSVAQLAEWIKARRRAAAEARQKERKVRISLRIAEVTESLDEEDLKALLGLLEEASGRTANKDS